MGNVLCFLLKSVLKKVNQLCSNFFLKGSSSSAKGARVSWKAICLPKAEDGLGLKDNLSWNQACNVKHLGNYHKAGSLWIEAYVLKGMSIWSVPVVHNTSWNGRKLFQLRKLL